MQTVGKVKLGGGIVRTKREWTETTVNRSQLLRRYDRGDKGEQAPVLVTYLFLCSGETNPGVRCAERSEVSRLSSKPHPPFVPCDNYDPPARPKIASWRDERAVVSGEDWALSGRQRQTVLDKERKKIKSVGDDESGLVPFQAWDFPAVDLTPV